MGSGNNIWSNATKSAVSKRERQWQEFPFGATAYSLGLLDRKPSIRQKLLYGLATIGIRYVWTKVGYYVTENSWGERTSGTKKKLWILLQYVDTAHETFSLVNFLLFLYNGHYRTIIDRLLGLRLVPLAGNSNRQVSFEFLNRQLVWHTLTEFLLFILPLLKLPRLKRQLEKRFIPTANEKGLLAFLPQRTCAICFQEQSAGGISTTIVNAYQADDCGHLYCYGCIVARLKLAEGDGWPCLRCGITIKEAHRWIEIVETPPSDQESDSEKSTG
ncbi:Peroxisomal biogenesis factor 2 [Neolecta irregularis DAH-3]|uniref:RING-type E3 ubiquitin transferase (cysteine targeting) n=1 Tax=Neolecta irregularis (strain DAH-3) TaxID=1198029 RepID=A0A1U7LQZ2_NEOID|nr:Peroxisomal biogenesis factor 2 [Neolecta irregularis DAH-3]|eukprot:OLL24972.1 Peroxisomal biogenesis factor 2 [Neolecta irregularis DAH-3]